MTASFVPHVHHRLPEAEMMQRAKQFYADMDQRRTVRQFSDEPVPRELIELAIQTASTAPSGAHRQPWTFVAVSDQELKARIREAAEVEEREFYEHKAPESWLKALEPLGTDAVKEHITSAPWVVVLFKHRYVPLADGEPAGQQPGGGQSRSSDPGVSAAPPTTVRSHTYYATESCGIAAGFFIAAVHLMGLTTLTHTPSPMGFLSEVLDRPKHEQAFLLLPVGYPAADATVPDIHRKPLDEVAVWR